MERESSQLKSLMESLSPHENRYVRQFISRHGKPEEKKIIELYDSFFKTKKQGQKISSFSSPSQQNYLYRTILKALRSYHESKTIDITLRERLINAALLYERRIYVSSLRELDAAQKIASENERWASVLEILSMKAEVILEHNSIDIIEKLRAIENESAEMHKRLGELTKLKAKQFQVYAFCRINYHQRTKENLHILRSFTPGYDAKKHSDASLFELHYLLMSDAAVAYFNGEYDIAMKRYGELLSVWEKYPERINSERLVYKRFLSNILSSAHATGNFKMMSQVLEKLKSLPVNTVEEEAEKFQNLIYMELLHLMNTDGYDNLPALSSQIEAGLLKYKTKVNKAREIAFYHNLSMAYFLIHNWKESLKWIEKIIAQEKTEHRLDLQHTARMLRLVLWYQLGKHDLLEYELVNVERFLRKRKAWFNYESTVVKFFGKLIITDENKRKALFEKFDDNLSKAVEGKTSAALPGSSELKYWTKSNLTGKNMRELLRDTSN